MTEKTFYTHDDFMRMLQERADSRTDEVKPAETYKKPKSEKVLYKERVASIKERLITDDDYLKLALKQIYLNHDTHVFPDGDTAHHDGKGFNRMDKDFLSNVAEFLIKRGFLSKKQIECIRPKMLKYAGQLADMEVA